MGKDKKKQGSRALREGLLQRASQESMELVSRQSSGLTKNVSMAPSDCAFGEEDNITCCECIPGSSLIAAGSIDGKVFLYNALTGLAVAKVDAHGTDLVNHVAVSRSYVVSCGDDCNAVIWRIEGDSTKVSLKKMKVLKGSGSILYGEVSPNQEFVVTCSSAGIARVWALDSGGEIGTLLQKLDADSGTVGICRITPDGLSVITGHSDGDAVVWSISTGKEVFRLEGHTQTVTDLAVTPDCSRVVTTSYDGYVRVWSLLNGEELELLDWHNGPVVDCSIDPTGETDLVVTSSEDGESHLYDYMTGELILRLIPDTDSGTVDAVPVTYSEWLDGSKKIAIGCADGSVHIFDRENGARVYATKPHDAEIGNVFVLGKVLVTYASDKIHTTVIDSKAIVATIEGQHGNISIVDVAFSENGLYCASASREIACVHNCRTGEKTAQVDIGMMPNGNPLSAIAIRGETLIVADVGGAVLGFNATSGRTEKVWNAPLQIDCDEYDEDDQNEDDIELQTMGDSVLLWSSKEIAVFDGNGSVRFKTSAIQYFKDEDDWFRWCTLDASGSRVLLCNCTGEGEIHKLSDGNSDKNDVELEGHSDGVRHAVFHEKEDGTSTVLTVSSDRQVIYWNAVTGEKIHTLQKHKGWVTFCNISRDGSRAVSCSVDKSAIVWDLTTGKALFSITAPGKVVEAYFTDDGRYIVVMPDGRHGAMYDAVSGRRVTFMFSWAFNANLSTFDMHGNLAAAGLVDGSVSFIRLDYTVKRQPAASTVMGLADVPGKWAIEDAQMLIDNCPQALANHIDGYTVVHDVVKKAKVKVLKVLASSPAISASFTIGGDKSVVRIALDTKQKSAMEILVEAYKAAPAHMRLGLDNCWDDFAKMYPDLVVTLMQGCCNKANPEIVGSVTKCAINPFDEVYPCPAEEEYPLMENDEPYWEVMMNGKRRIRGGGVVPVDAYYVGIPGLAGSGKNIGQTAFHCIVRHEIADAFGTPAMTALLNYKWKAFGLRNFLMNVLAYMLFLIIICPFTVEYAEGYKAETAVGKAFFWIRFTLIGAYSFAYFCFEALQILKNPIYYWISIWNWMELATYLLIPAYLVMIVIKNEYANQVGSCVAILLWLKTLSFARGFRGTGAFVKMLFAVLEDIKYFMFVLALVIIGFSHAFFLSLAGVDGYETIWKTLFTMFRATVGDFDVDAYDDGLVPGLAIAFFVLFSGLVVIILLNLLIAVLSDSYSKIQGNAVNEWKLEQAKIVTETESVMTSSSLKNEKYFPRFLHFLAPQDYPVVVGGPEEAEAESNSLDALAARCNAAEKAALRAVELLEETRRDMNARLQNIAHAMTMKKKERKSIFSKLIPDHDDDDSE